MAKNCCCCDKTTVKKGAWTPEEDRRLIAYVKRYGHWNWRQLPKFAGLSRCGKSCRLRWKNYLRPDIKRGNYTQEEEETIIKLYTAMGGRWSVMATHMPGRTDNDIKNHWNTVLKRRVMIMKKPLTNQPAKTSSIHDVSAYDEKSSSNVDHEIPEKANYSSFIDQMIQESTLENIEAAIQPSMADDYAAAVTNDVNISEESRHESSSSCEMEAISGGDFWRDPLWLDSFEFQVDEHQLFGESNVFTPLLDEFLCQVGIY